MNASRAPYRSATKTAREPIDIGPVGAIYSGVELRTARWGVAACRRPDGVIVTAHAALPRENDRGMRAWPFVRAFIHQVRLWNPRVSFARWAISVHERGEPLDERERATPAEHEVLVAEPRTIAAGPIVTFVVTSLTLTLLGHGVIALLAPVADFDLGARSPAAHGTVAAARVVAFASYMLLLRRSDDLRQTYRYVTAVFQVLNAHVRALPVATDAIRDVLPMNPTATTNSMGWMYMVWSAVAWAATDALGGIGVFEVTGHAAMLAVEVACLPVAIAVAFEMRRAAWSLFRSGRLAPLWPILCVFQNVTVVEPTDAHLEVAIVAYRELLELEGEDPRA